jgi:hypothetical protein
MKQIFGDKKVSEEGTHLYNNRQTIVIIAFFSKLAARSVYETRARPVPEVGLRTWLGTYQRPQQNYLVITQR